MKKFFICLLAAISLTGCYEGAIKKAYQELKVGAPKAEIDRLFKDFKFIKEQTVLVHGTASEEETRGVVWTNTYKDFQPDQEKVLRSFTFDGNTKVFSYLIDTESNWPNNKMIYYVAIFYDKLNDKVIGKAILSTIVQTHNWNEKY